MTDEFHPDMLDFKPFVRYDPGDGSITDCGLQGVWFTRREFDQGVPILATVEQYEAIRDKASVYVDLSKGVPILTLRPVLALEPSTLTPAAGEEVSIAGVPACAVRFEGPLAGEQEHDGQGPLEIGWTVPGTYTLSIRAWPAHEATLTIEVQL